MSECPWYSVRETVHVPARRRGRSAAATLLYWSRGTKFRSACARALPSLCSTLAKTPAPMSERHRERQTDKQTERQTVNVRVKESEREGEERERQ
jgi:hypothetical protein